MTSSSIAPAIISMTRGGDVFLQAQDAQRRAALAGAVERREITASLTTCSGSAELSTIIAFWPPVSAISGTIGDRARRASARSRCRDLGRSGERDAGDARDRRQSAAPTISPAPGSSAQRVGGNARLEQHDGPRARR